MTVRAESTLEKSEPEYRERSDGDLVSALVDHDEDAFAELFRRHSQSVGAASRMILGNGAGCDDVVAEVFLTLWISPLKFDLARGSLIGFLRMKAKQRSIDVVRSETARIRRERAETASLQITWEGIDSDLIASENAAGVNRAVASLTAHEKEPIELAFHQGMTYASIAIHLGIPEGTIKSRIRSGLRHLRENIELQLQRQPDDDEYAKAYAHPFGVKNTGRNSDVEGRSS